MSYVAGVARRNMVDWASQELNGAAPAGAPFDDMEHLEAFLFYSLGHFCHRSHGQ